MTYQILHLPVENTLHIEDFSGGLSDEQQRALGKPTSVAQLNPQKVQDYLATLSGLLGGTIDFLRPSSLLNQAIYDNLSEENQGIVDNACVILMGNLRMLKGLIDLGNTTSSQAEYYVQQIWQYKEKLEKKVGDVLIL